MLCQSVHLLLGIHLDLFLAMLRVVKFNEVLGLLLEFVKDVSVFILSVLLI